MSDFKNNPLIYQMDLNLVFMKMKKVWRNYHNLTLTDFCNKKGGTLIKKVYFSSQSNGRSATVG